MVYCIVASFDVPTEHRDKFIDATATAGQESCAQEPGTLVFTLVEDSQVADRFHLIEEYADAAAFGAHSAGPRFRRFFDTLADWGQPGPNIVVQGARIPLR